MHVHVHLFTILFYDKLLRKENPINHKVKIHELIHIEFLIAWSRYLKQIFIPFFTILIQGNGSDSFLQNKINAGYFYGTPSCFCIIRALDSMHTLYKYNAMANGTSRIKKHRPGSCIMPCMVSNFLVK